MVADRAHCSVWQLQDAPAYWVERIRQAVIAENGAAIERQKAAERRARSKQRMGGR